MSKQFVETNDVHQAQENSLVALQFGDVVFYCGGCCDPHLHTKQKLQEYQVTLDCSWKRVLSTLPRRNVLPLHSTLALTPRFYLFAL